MRLPKDGIPCFIRESVRGQPCTAGDAWTSPNTVNGTAYHDIQEKEALAGELAYNAHRQGHADAIPAKGAWALWKPRKGQLILRTFPRNSRPIDSLHLSNNAPKPGPSLGQLQPNVSHVCVRRASQHSAKADARSKGVLGVVGMATTGFMRDQGTSAAAAIIMLMTWIVSPVFTLLSRVPTLNSVLQGFLAPVVEWLLVWLVVGCLVFVAYHQVTGVRVWRPAAFRAALLVIVIWQLLALGFGWWANSSFVHYDRVYGHLSLLITALLSIYLSAILVLAGAHLAASIQRRWGPAASSGTAPKDQNAM